MPDPSHLAFLVSAPHATRAKPFVFATAATHTNPAKPVPEALLDTWSYWQAVGFDVFLTFGSTPAIEADGTQAGSAPDETAVADADSIKTSFATSTVSQRFSGAGLNGVIGALEISPTSIITITQSNHANHDAVDVEISGKLSDGSEFKDVIRTIDGGNATVYGKKHAKFVTEVFVPGMSGTSGTIEIGTTLRIAGNAKGCVRIPAGSSIPLYLQRERDLFMSFEAAGVGILAIYPNSDD